MLLVPKGIKTRWQSCLYTSRPFALWCCRCAMAAAAVVVLIRVYLRLLARCIQLSASSGVSAAAVSSTSPFRSCQQIWVDAVLYAHVCCELAFPLLKRCIVSIICGWLQLQSVC